ncbi:unnamed protein product [Dovyalis caffra]|uniref:DUF674 family protein n=1 Tax=Dovyalis caffra TaxID=77055 RepID=A0AAV1RT42_9ROSI|nr:unnamed protein product [Dovyalis caffra]
MDAKKSISLKALVDKKRNKVVLVESGKDFVDVLFSFLTMPMGTIIRLISNGPPTVGIGCMNNLYESVENLGAMIFRNETCKKMLLRPQNAAATYFNMFYPRCGSVFVKGTTCFIVTDKLQVMPASTAVTVSLLTKDGVKDASAIEEMTFDIGENEVLNLLRCLLVSKTPLTDTFLQDKIVSAIKEDFKSGLIRAKKEEYESKGIKKIDVRLLLSKSKNMLCYAEASDDFVDLVFSFLTIPLGCFAKEVHGSDCSIGCVNNLYNSVQQLDSDKYLKSNEHKEFLLSPKIAPGFGIQNQLLRLEEVVRGHKPCYTCNEISFLSCLLNVMDPQSPYKNYLCEYDGGFVLCPGMFTVADNLIITPISPVSGLSVLKELKVPFSDVEEHVVHVGYEEAVRLMIASLVSESALSDTFGIPKQPKNVKSFEGE